MESTVESGDNGEQTGSALNCCCFWHVGGCPGLTRKPQQIILGQRISSYGEEKSAFGLSYPMKEICLSDIFIKGKYMLFGASQVAHW